MTSAAPTAAARVRLRPVDARGVAIRDGLLAGVRANYPKVSQAIWTAIQSAITGTSSVSSALQTAQGTVSGVQQVSGG